MSQLACKWKHVGISSRTLSIHPDWKGLKGYRIFKKDVDDFKHEIRQEDDNSRSIPGPVEVANKHGGSAINFLNTEFKYEKCLSANGKPCERWYYVNKKLGYVMVIFKTPIS